MALNETVRIPQPVADALRSLSEAEQAEAFSQAMSAALKMTPAERVELMRDALSVSQGGMTDCPLPDVDLAVLGQFEGYVASKHLWRDVLLTGALMRQLEVAAGDKSKLPWCPAVPREE
ncbi:MAG: hypothetical protein AB2L09_01585 [Coriobacteriia bacterium]